MHRIRAPSDADRARVRLRQVRREQKQKQILWFWRRFSAVSRRARWHRRGVGAAINRAPAASGAEATDMTVGDGVYSVVRGFVVKFLFDLEILFSRIQRGE